MGSKNTVSLVLIQIASAVMGLAFFERARRLAAAQAVTTLPAPSTVTPEPKATTKTTATKTATTAKTETTDAAA